LDNGLKELSTNSAMVDNTPLSSSDPPQEQQYTQQPEMNRTRSRELVADHHQIVDEDPLLISQTLTYVTDDGSVIHSFQSDPFSFGTSRLHSFIVLFKA
jgi:hypothetical protein